MGRLGNNLQESGRKPAVTLEGKKGLKLNI